MDIYKKNAVLMSINISEYNFLVMTEAKKNDGDFDVTEELLQCLKSSRNSALNEP